MDTTYYWFLVCLFQMLGISTLVFMNLGEIKRTRRLTVPTYLAARQITLVSAGIGFATTIALNGFLGPLWLSTAEDSVFGFLVSSSSLVIYGMMDMAHRRLKRVVAKVSYDIIVSQRAPQ